MKINSIPLKFKILLQHEDTWNIATLHYSFADIFNWKANTELNNMSRYFVIWKFTFTWLHDKNWTEIYEWDIIEYYLDSIIKSETWYKKWTVIYSIEEWWFKIQKLDNMLTDLNIRECKKASIVWNIYINQINPCLSQNTTDTK